MTGLQIRKWFSGNEFECKTAVNVLTSCVSIKCLKILNHTVLDLCMNTGVLEITAELDVKPKSRSLSASTYTFDNFSENHATFTSTRQP